MRFDVATSFGYPVFRTLTPDQNPEELDYPDKTFQPPLTIKRSVKNPDVISVALKDIDKVLTVKELQDLVGRGFAELQLSVECPKTFYSALFKFEQGAEIELNANVLSGMVDYMVFLTVKKSFSFSPVEVHEDFKGIEFKMEPGQVLAVSQPVTRIVDKDQYKTVKAIFELAPDPAVKEGEFRLITTEDYVIIQLHPKTYESVNVGQANLKRRLVLVTSFFVPILIQLLYILKDSPDARYDHRWGQVIMQKLGDMGLDVEDENEIPNHAQRLWSMPFLELSDKEFGV